MHNNYSLSIIIPAYNSAQNIGACLDSILKQTGSDKFQIIVVNDGSTDETQSVVEKYTKKHSNIVLLNQKNSGVSRARNAGIRNAVGDYITFVDSDDQVGLKYSAYEQYFTNHSVAIDNLLISKTYLPDEVQKNIYSDKYFKNMLDVANDTDADVVLGGKITINTGEKYIKRHIYEQQKIFSTTPDDKSTVLVQADYRESANFCLYSKAFLKKKHLLFARNMQLDEDILFCMLACLYAKKVATVPDVTYLYNRHENSLSNAMYQETSNQKYTLANIQRFSKLLVELSKYPKYSSIYTHWLHLFSYECNKRPQNSLYAEHFPPTRCATCPFDKCDDNCFLSSGENYVLTKLRENIKSFSR